LDPKFSSRYSRKKQKINPKRRGEGIKIWTGNRKERTNAWDPKYGGGTPTNLEQETGGKAHKYGM
jgi:hypothetical protein